MTELSKGDVAWRGVVTKQNEVIAWPMMLATHADFHSTFYTNDADFSARWRQWNPGGEVDFDPGFTPEAEQAVYAFLNGP